ncbi:MAG TPA: GDSL-type esterase/lipase family protein [Alphaproteobacteria bacterium]|nr:GDSL-type esterase/lipase family protein [Alphaproteobacteria bacterium]
MTTLRICFVGDSITLGTGDSRYLGWPGRVCAAEAAHGHDLSLYNLGVRGDTSVMIAERWRAECAARLPDGYPGALVFAFGVNDTAEEDGSGLRVAVDRSLSAARAIMTAAAKWRKTLWLGPAPLSDEHASLPSPTGIQRSFRDARVRQLSNAYAAIATDLAVPYLDLHERLQREARWSQALAAGDGVHPAADGYALVAELVGNWSAWRTWIDE